MPDTLLPAFEVIDPKTGQRWMIYPDGRVRGFGECIIINRIPQIEAQAFKTGFDIAAGGPHG